MEIVTIAKVYDSDKVDFTDPAGRFLLRWSVDGLIVERCVEGSVLNYDNSNLLAVKLEVGVIDWATVLQGQRSVVFRVGETAVICAVENDPYRILTFLKKLKCDERWTVLEHLYIENPLLDLVEQICQIDGIPNPRVWKDRRLSLMVQSMVNVLPSDDNILPSDERERLSKLTTDVKMSYL